MLVPRITPFEPGTPAECLFFVTIKAKMGPRYRQISEQSFLEVPQIRWSLTRQHGGKGPPPAPSSHLSPFTVAIRRRPARHALQFPDPRGLVLCVVPQHSGK